MMKSKLSTNQIANWGAKLFLILALLSCKKDHFDFDKLASTDWEPSIAVPLVNAHMDVYDILAATDSNDLLVINENTGFIALVYEEDIFSLSSSEVLDLEDQSTSQSLSLSAAEIAVLSGVGTVQHDVAATYTFTTEAGVLLDSLVLMNGTLNLAIFSDFQHSGSLEVSIPSLTLNGIAFSETLPIDYTGSPVTIDESYDISGYTIDLTNGGMTNNEIALNIGLTLNFSGNPTDESDRLEITESFTNLEFESAHGYLGQKSLNPGPDSLTIDIFNTATEGFFQLTDPQLTLTIENSFGIPIDMSLLTLKTVNIQSGVETQIDVTGFPNPFPIDAPSSIGENAITELLVDNSNSNLSELMNPTPKYMIQEFESEMNPDGPPASNFISHESELNIHSELLLPMEGYAYGWTLVDTFEFALVEENIEEVESVLIRNILTNGFPIDANVQVYLTDSSYTVLDSLMDFEDNIISSGIINGEGRVIQSTEKVTDIAYDQSRVPNLLNADYVIIKASMATTQADVPEIIRIYDDYDFQVKIGLKADASISF